MVLPPPESSVTNQSPEAFVAIVTLFVIAVLVYSLTKIKLSSLKMLLKLFLFQPTKHRALFKEENRPTSA